MKLITSILPLAFLFPISFAQTSELAKQHYDVPERLKKKLDISWP